MSSKFYICKTCHSNLHDKNNREPTIPRMLLKCKKSAASKFLNAIDNKPEYVCTCCHRWLFKKSVNVFNEKKFDFDNIVVANALSGNYRYKMKQCQSDDVSQLNTEDIQAFCEYICTTCKRCLSAKKIKDASTSCGKWVRTFSSS